LFLLKTGAKGAEFGLARLLQSQKSQIPVKEPGFGGAVSECDSLLTFEGPAIRFPPEVKFDGE